MPGKIARSTPRPPFGPPVVRAAARSSRLASRELENRYYSRQFGGHLGECRHKSVFMNQQATLHPTTLTVLQDIYSADYSADELYGTESAKPVPLDGISKTSFEQGAAIHALMRDRSIKRSLEVGMAYGFSTVWMIEAHRFVTYGHRSVRKNTLARHRAGPSGPTGI